MQGFLTNVLNPKVVLFFLSFFPQFVDPHASHKAAAFLALGVVFIAMSTVWNSMVAWVAASVTRRVAGKPGIKRWLDRVTENGTPRTLLLAWLARGLGLNSREIARDLEPVLRRGDTELVAAKLDLEVGLPPTDLNKTNAKEKSRG